MPNDVKDNQRPGKEVYGPAMPPNPEFALASNRVQISTTEHSGNKPIEIYGPVLPSHLKEHKNALGIDIIGPSIPSDTTLGTLPIQVPKKPVYGPQPVSVQQSPPKRLIAQPKVQETAPSKREDWMLQPPEAKPLSKDTKSRGFRKGGVPEIDSSGWTKLPNNKSAKATSNAVKAPSQLLMKDIEYKKFTEQHNVLNTDQALHRPVPLMEQHKRLKKGNDVADNKFNRERVFSTQSMSADKASDIVSRAKELNSKFSHGSSNYL